MRSVYLLYSILVGCGVCKALVVKFPANRAGIGGFASRSRDQYLSGKPHKLHHALEAAASSAEGAWVDKRLHNTNAFRSVAILGALGVAGGYSSSPVAALLSAKVAAAIHVLSFSSWFGAVMYTTFVLGITMFKNLPRQTFGKLQAKLFPKYFSLSSLALVLQLVTTKKLAVIPRNSVTALAVALAMTLLNQFYLEPVSTNSMMKRYQLEEKDDTESEDYKKLRAQFGKLHGMSSLTNLIALCAGVVHAVLLSAALV